MPPVLVCVCKLGDIATLVKDSWKVGKKVVCRYFRHTSQYGAVRGNIFDEFDVQRLVVTKHLKIFGSKKLERNVVSSILEHTSKDGKTYGNPLPFRSHSTLGQGYLPALLHL